VALGAMIMEFGLSDRVFTLGERRDIPQLNAAFDIASSASAWGEGFANVIGEAMSCGVPCVVTDVGDSAWIVGNTGKVVARRDPVALAAAWKSLILLSRIKRQQLGIQARQRVIENFSLESVVKQYEDLYSTLIVREGS
jgi:glycosyltransferase involved in cell wall biosynthesis